MPTYILQPGNHVIQYPESGRTLPADLPSFLTTMEPSFRKLLAVHPYGRDDPDLILEAFRRFLQDLSPRYSVPQWQVYKFGQRKWPYAKWLLDKLAWFLADQSKLLHALAELEREREQRVQMPMEEIVVNLSEFGAEEAEPEQRVACQMSTIHLNIKDFSAPEAANQFQALNH